MDLRRWTSTGGHTPVDLHRWTSAGGATPVPPVGLPTVNVTSWCGSSLIGPWRSSGQMHPLLPYIKTRELTTGQIYLRLGPVPHLGTIRISPQCVLHIYRNKDIYIALLDLVLFASSNPVELTRNDNKRYNMYYITTYSERIVLNT